MKSVMLALLSFLLCAAPVVGAEHAQAGEDSRWGAFDLRVMEVDGLRVHYEAVFEDEAQALAGVISEHLTEGVRQAVANLSGGSVREMAVEALRLAGVAPERPEAAGVLDALPRMYDAWAGKILFAGRLDDLYIVRAASIKDHLRAGGALPGFTYDAGRDEVTYTYGVSVGDGSLSDDAQALVLPVVGPVQASRALDRFLSMMSPATTLGVMVHEAAEMGVIIGLRPGDPHVRWFGEGAANIIAEHVLAERVGPEIAAKFAATSDTAEYADLKAETNLMHWMANDYCVDTPLESEGRLSNARYAFATFEVRRLVEGGGIAVLAKIADECETTAPTTPDSLLATIEKATGEDMRARLLAYQSFGAPEEGMAEYARRSNEALAGRDYEAMLANTLRILELKDEYDVDFYRGIADVLVRMGREDYADALYRKQLATMRRRGAEGLVRGLQVKFIDYALGLGKPQKAHAVAEEVLAAAPDYVPAIAVRMHRLVTGGEVVEAEAAARRILELDAGRDSSFADLARKVIANISEDAAAAPPGDSR